MPMTRFKDMNDPRQHDRGPLRWMPRKIGYTNCQIKMVVPFLLFLASAMYFSIKSILKVRLLTSISITISRPVRNGSHGSVLFWGYAVIH